MPPLIVSLNNDDVTTEVPQRPLYSLLWPELETIEDLWALIPHYGAELAVVKELFKHRLVSEQCRHFNIDPITNPDILKQRLGLFRKTLQLTNDKAYQLYLARTRQTEKQVLERIIAQDMVQRLKQTVIAQEQIKDVYINQKRKEDKVVFNMLRVKTKALAQEIYFQITQDKTPFAALVSQYSLGQEKQSQGVIGPTKSKDLNPLLKQALQSLKPGQTSAPLDVGNDMWIIVQLLRWDRYELTPALEKSIRNELFERWMDQQYVLALTAQESFEKNPIPQPIYDFDLPEELMLS